MVHGRAQHYAWGDRSSIPEMVDQSADGQPWAEWWMGTHPLLPSTIDDGSSLESVAGDLPYLLKLMAAAQPLSLQTHPDQHQAAAGFEREEQLGIPRDSPTRTYRDEFAKPEMLCALDRRSTRCAASARSTTRSSVLRDIGAHDLADCLQHDKLAAVVESIYRQRVRHGIDDRGVPAARSVGKPTLSPSSPRRTPAIRRSS